MMIAIDKKYLQENDLVPYAQELLNGLLPILERLDDSKVSPRSGITWEKQKKGLAFLLKVIPSDESVPFLDLWVAPDQCILGFADSEQIEAHGISSDWKRLTSLVLAETEWHLNGITVIERFNRNHKLVGKTYFWGIDTELDRKSLIGSCAYWAFPRKVVSVVKRTYRFLK